ncbi:DUF2252 domain-containing protein [Spirillospora sp. CA-128828]|uniref:DUF2252 domain-containing protein n=1 Tax=Spirillospora sp. CA-128828 TaxID=3240033 RepID=UPI003D8F608D
MTTARSDHLSPSERAAYGKAARARVPRTGHAAFEPDGQRPDPIGVIERQSAERVPELAPIRYGRMLESPFRFYRGAAAIMAADLGPAPHTGITTQLCGDAHLLNFRLLASAERHLLFDINDFDETLPGPFEWDVKRLATSFVIAARANAFTAGERRAIVRTCVQAYRKRMHDLAAMRTLDVWYAQDDADQLQAILQERLDKNARRRASRAKAKARTRDNIQAFDKLTRPADGRRRRINPDPPLITPIADLLPDEERSELERTLRGLLQSYRRSLSPERRHLLSRFHPVDMARKVVGVGSVGTRCWIVLMLGRDDEDPLLLQAKEAGESVLAPYAAAARQRDFYVRQLRDWKGIAQPETMPPDTMELFGRLCGASLARAHARSGDPIAIAAYLGKSDAFDRALGEFAESYADQNERDHRALADAVKGGRVTAQSV